MGLCGSWVQRPELSCPKLLHCPGLYDLCHPGSSLILAAGSGPSKPNMSQAPGQQKGEHTTKWLGWKSGSNIRCGVGGWRMAEVGGGCWKLEEVGGCRLEEIGGR